MMTEHLVLFYQWLTSWMTTLSYDIVHYAWLYLWLCGQAYFQEQLYNSTLLGCSECYTQLIPLHFSHVTWGWWCYRFRGCHGNTILSVGMFLEPCLGGCSVGRQYSEQDLQNRRTPDTRQGSMSNDIINNSWWHHYDVIMMALIINNLWAIMIMLEVSLLGIYSAETPYMYLQPVSNSSRDRLHKCET